MKEFHKKSIIPVYFKSRSVSGKALAYRNIFLTVSPLRKNVYYVKKIEGLGFLLDILFKKLQTEPGEKGILVNQKSMLDGRGPRAQRERLKSREK